MSHDNASATDETLSPVQLQHIMEGVLEHGKWTPFYVEKIRQAFAQAERACVSAVANHDGIHDREFVDPDSGTYYRESDFTAPEQSRSATTTDDAKDAARYRWLRQNLQTDDRMVGYCVRRWSIHTDCSVTSIDAHIDAMTAVPDSRKA